MKKKIIDMGQIRETAMLRRALKDMAQQEIRAALRDETLDADYERTLSGVQAHIARKTAVSRPRRSLRIAAVLAAALVVFSGACLASEEVRDNVLALVETAFGRNIQVRAVNTNEADKEPVTVEPDDVRLRYVYPDWCLHYYPLEIPSHFTKVDVAYGQPRTATMITHVTDGGNVQSWESGFYFLSDDARAKWLAEDYQEITFTSAEMGGRFYHFIEDGRVDNEARLDSISQNITHESIDGKEVLVVEDNGLISFIWQEDGHLLTLTSNDERIQMEYVFSTVERIR